MIVYLESACSIMNNISSDLKVHYNMFDGIYSDKEIMFGLVISYDVSLLNTILEDGVGDPWIYTESTLNNSILTSAYADFKQVYSVDSLQKIHKSFSIRYTIYNPDIEYKRFEYLDD